MTLPQFVKRLIQFNAANAASGTDVIYADQGNGEVAMTAAQLASFVQAPFANGASVATGTALIVHLPDGASATAIGLRTLLLDRPNGKNWRMVGDGPTGGASPAGATDNTSFLSNALAQVPYGTTLTFVGNIYLSGRVPMQSGVNLRIKGTVTFGAIGTGFDFSGVNNAGLHIDNLYGDGVSNSSGVVMSGGNDNRIHIGGLYNFANKGIVLGGSAQRNKIFVQYASGCTGTFGAAIALSGNGVINNDIQLVYGYQNRIGITINSAYGNRVHDSRLEYNQQIGLAIDGTVTGAGDGGFYNQISNVQCNYNGTTSTAYGGFYLGNGSSFNQFSNCSANNNQCAGILSSGGVGYQPTDNAFQNLQVTGNAKGGAIFSNAPGTKISNLDSQNNTGGPALQFFTSDGCYATNVKCSNNAGQTGIVIQSANCKIFGGESKGNANGINIGAGGSTVYTGNIIEGVDLSGYSPAGNAATIANTSARLTNCAGVGTESFGQTTIADGAVINHLCYGTPQWADFSSSNVTHTARVSAISGSTATLSLKDSTGASVTTAETVRYNFKFNFGA